MVVAKRQRREKLPARFWLLFLCFSPPRASLCKMGQAGVLFVSPEVLTLVLRPSFVLFLGLSPSFSFSHNPFELLFPLLAT